MDKSLAVFEGQKIRRHYDEKTETWYFSVVDIIMVLIQQADYQAARNYWKVLKSRLKNEGSEVVTKCNQLKLLAEDGKMRETDAALAELSTRQIAEGVNATGMPENTEAGKKGGGIAKRARLDLEHKTGRKIVTDANYLPPSSTKRIKDDAGK